MRDRALREGGDDREDGRGRRHGRGDGDRSVCAWRSTLPLADGARRLRNVVSASARPGHGLPAVFHRREAAAHQRVHVDELGEDREKEVRGAADEVEPAPTIGPHEVQQPYTLESQCTGQRDKDANGSGEIRQTAADARGTHPRRRHRG